MPLQNTAHLLMIRPVHFTYNEQTAVNNAFQQKENSSNVQQQALQEFDAFVTKLTHAGVDVTVVNDTAQPHTPDSVFPNNWISLHTDGTVFLYPMYAVNRRAERKAQVTESIKQKFIISKIIDLTASEQENKFLEGTGSMVLDRENKIAYACISQRTDETLLNKFCKHTGYTPCLFCATDGKGKEIYHTNVMMCAADKYVVICIESIRDAAERKFVTDTIAGSGKIIIEISMLQMNHFAGNMLQVINAAGEKILVMSTQAFQSLHETQVSLLSAFNKILHSSLNTIETNGGGSARCMMAEVFLPLKQWE